MSLLPLPTVKEFLQIMHNKEDIVLQIMLDAIEEWVAAQCALKFNTGSTVSNITEDVDGGSLNLRPDMHPILGVTKILDRDASDVEVDTTFWRNNNTRVWFTDGSIWGIGVERFRMTYTAGYTEDTLPNGLKLAILQLMHRSYNKRGGVSSDSVAGYGESWDEFFSSDDVKMLRAFSFRQVFA